MLASFPFTPVLSVPSALFLPRLSRHALRPLARSQRFLLHCVAFLGFRASMALPCLVRHLQALCPSAQAGFHVCRVPVRPPCAGFGSSCTTGSRLSGEFRRPFGSPRGRANAHRIFCQAACFAQSHPTALTPANLWALLFARPCLL